MALGSIHHLDFYVDDLEETVKFLTEKLGFEITWQTEGMCRLKTPLGSELWEFRQLTDDFRNASPYDDKEELGQKGSLFRPYLSHIAFEVDDLQKTYDEMKSKGAPFKHDKDRPNFNKETGGGMANTYDNIGRRWIQMVQKGKADKKDEPHKK